MKKIKRNLRDPERFILRKVEGSRRVYPDSSRVQSRERSREVYPEHIYPEFYRGGFTLIEVLIAVIILTMVVGSAVALEQANIQGSVVNMHKLQAIGLAQEGINAIRTIRDRNLLDPRRSIWQDLGTNTITEDSSYKLEKDTDGSWILVGPSAGEPNAEQEIIFGEQGKPGYMKFTRKIYLYNE